jgi:hypothetical protein
LITNLIKTTRDSKVKKEADKEYNNRLDLTYTLTNNRNR